MIDLKLNYLVYELTERLGFVTKKHKMDHIMSQLAKAIGSKSEILMEKNHKEVNNRNTEKTQILRVGHS